MLRREQVGSAVAYGRVDAAGTLFALGATAPVARTTATLTRRLTEDRRSRRFARTTGQGKLSLELTTPAPTKLTLKLVRSDGTTVARRSGATPLRLAKAVAAGRHRFVVRGPRGVETAFTLLAKYPTP